MQARWVFLRVDRETTVALPVEEVHRVLHRMDSDYPAFASTARSLAAVLQIKPEPDLPGILVVLVDGACWHAGDSSLEALPPGAAYISLPPDLFAGTPWCRGALLSAGRCAFVTDSSLLERAFR
jgi:hypothetical protein